MSSDDRPLPPDGLTYYQLLGISEDAPESDVQNAYRQLIKWYHPDQWDHWAADDVAERLRDAYDVLTDPRARQRYNQVGHEEYTGVESASFSDVQNWLMEIQRLVDVENPAKVDDITRGQEGIINAGDDFETSDESMSAEEIFNDINEELTPDVSWDEAIEEVDSETGTDDQPDYVASKDVDDIDDSRLSSQSDGDDEREPTSISHEEEVKERAATRKRLRDPTQVVSTPGQQDVDKTNVENPNAPDRDETSILELPRNAVNRVQEYLSDDVVSRAVRQAWLTRIAATVVLVGVLTGLGELITGGAGDASLLPSVTAITTGAGGGLWVVVGATIIVYVADQIKTESDTSRGMINTAVSPSRFGGYMIALNAIGLASVCYAAMNGGNAIKAVVLLTNGSLPTGYWMGNTMLDAFATVGTFSLIGLGFIFGIGAVTRYSWYYRYVKGYRILPGVWDMALFVPLVAVVWMYLAGYAVVSVPTGLSSALLMVSPDMMAVLGVGTGSLTREFVTLFAVCIPTVVGIPVLLRRLVETGLRKVYT